MPWDLNRLSTAPQWRGTQVAKGEVCKTFIQGFESPPRLHIKPSLNIRYHFC